MPSQWESIHEEITRSIRSEKSRRTFEALKAEHPALQPFEDGASLVRHFNTGGCGAATLDEKDRIAAALVTAAGDSGTAELAIEILLLGLWPGLTSAFGRLLRIFERRPTELASEIVAEFAVCVRHLDLTGCTRVVATLVRNTERDVLAGWKAEQSAASRTEALSAEADDVADAAADGAVALADLRIWLTKIVPRDADLILTVCLSGRDCHQVGDALGMNHETARKRFARAVAKIRPLLRARLSQMEGAGPRFSGDEQAR